MKQSTLDRRIGGLTRLSTCDWPDQLAATIFCQGCGWDCAYCHNPGLRPASASNLLSWPGILQFLATRRGLLDAVVFSGGEPTLQPALADAIAEVKRMKFRVGLHTAGMNPEGFAQLLPSLDWVGFDVKAPFAEYARITGIAHSGTHALESLRSLLASGIGYEVRTTLHPALLSTTDLLQIKEQLIALGVAHFAVQQFRAQGVVPGRLPAAPSITLPLDYGQGFASFIQR